MIGILGHDSALLTLGWNSENIGEHERLIEEENCHVLHLFKCKQISNQLNVIFHYPTFIPPDLVISRAFPFKSQASLFTVTLLSEIDAVPRTKSHKSMGFNAV